MECRCHNEANKAFYLADNVIYLYAWKLYLKPPLIPNPYEVILLNKDDEKPHNFKRSLRMSGIHVLQQILGLQV